MGIGKYIKNDQNYLKEMTRLEEEKKKEKSTKKDELNITDYLNKEEHQEQSVDIDLSSSTPMPKEQVNTNEPSKPKWTSAELSLFSMYPDTEGIVKLEKKVNVGREINTSSSILSSKQLDHMNIFSSYNARLNIREQVKNKKKGV